MLKISRLSCLSLLLALGGTSLVYAADVTSNSGGGEPRTAAGGDKKTVMDAKAAELGKKLKDKTAARLPQTDEEWKKKLPPFQYYVTRKKGTEPAFTGKYWNNHENGIYKCADCGTPLFSSQNKFDSGTGWPSFDRPVVQAAVKNNEDTSFGMRRDEAICSNCGAHLGHVFDDGPQNTTGKRFCINSASLEFSRTSK